MTKIIYDIDQGLANKIQKIYDHLYDLYILADPEKRADMIKTLEVGKWVGILTDPDNHQNVIEDTELHPED